MKTHQQLEFKPIFNSISSVKFDNLGQEIQSVC